MKKLMGFVFNRWTLAAVIFTALALSVWIVGPVVAVAERRPLETGPARWWTIGLLALSFGLRMGWTAWRAYRGNAALAKELLDVPPGKAGSGAESADLMAVRQRFEHAVQTLRKTRIGAGGRLAGWKARVDGRYLYELPWYVIIGAPGSGKTTALQNCGLKFPLASRLGDPALQGVGGTRHCDWWFTDQAVMIDTAGRFTTQEDDGEISRATWSGFLAMLKRTRPRQPLNGALVTVSVELLLQGATARAEYAAKVRQRVQELDQELGIRIPVYLLVTKSDLLAGFMEYFATIDKDQRSTPWGTTFPLHEGNAKNLQQYGAEFDALSRRLRDGLVQRLQEESDLPRRTRLYGFPIQFGRLKGVLQEFLHAVFAPSRFEADPMLRGVYFVSGTQEGAPIDRVLGTVARAYRLESAAIAPNQSSGRSYFLSRVLSEVVFAESGLVGRNKKWEHRAQWATHGAYAGLTVLLVGTLTAWGVSYSNNRHYVDDVARRVDAVRKTVLATPNRATADLLPVVPALTATRGLARDASVATGMLGFGLQQISKLDTAAQAAYRRMLVDAVLPRLGLRVEDQLRQASASGQGQYEALKAYLMLHDPDHFDSAALKAYVEADWDTELGRSVDEVQRADLSHHLDTLLVQGAAVSPLPADKALIDFHRNRLAQSTLPQRIYDRMRQQGLGADFPEFTVLRAAGDKAALVFTRASSEPLSRGVPGLFTYDGYHRGFQKQVVRVAEQLAGEQSWVLGIAETARSTDSRVRADASLVDDVRRLYLNEYVATWEAFIADVKLQPQTSIAQSIQMAQLLSASDSPLPALLRAMAKQTTLLAPEAKSVVEKAGDRVSAVLDDTREVLTSALADGRSPISPTRIESIVDERFGGLRRMVTAQGGKAPIDEAVALIGEVQVLLRAVDDALRERTVPPPSPLRVKLKTAATQMPQPLRGMLEDLSDTSARATQLGTRENLSGEVKSLVGEFCQQALAGRYPVDRNAQRDATQADFATLFGPGGRFELMQQKLARFVDERARPTWRFRDGENGPLGTDVGSLPQFQRAQAIRETFFPGANVPMLRLQFKPVEMDASLKQFVLDVDGQVVRYDHGPQIPVQVQWPGPRGGAQVRVQLNPPAATGASGTVYEGPWALLRMFDHVKIEPSTAPERFRATFDVDGRKAVFEITAGSVRNPFRLRELSEFSCPMGL